MGRRRIERWTLVFALALAGCARRPPAHVAPVSLFPTPRYFVQSGLPLATHPALAFATTLPSTLDDAARAAWDAGGYDRFVVIAHAGSFVAYGESARAVAYARAAAAALVDADGWIHEATLVDGSPLPLRGVVEGYYGTPLQPSERSCLIDTMATLRQTTYLYGPKDDPYAHARWAEPYPADAAGAIAAAAARADARGIDFVWAVSPGYEPGYAPPESSISYASDGDFARLSAKIDAMRALGVTRFALFLDDIDPSLQFDADRAAFATPAAAHAALANRLDAYVTAAGAPHLLFVGPTYSQHWSDWHVWADDAGARLAPGIEVMWTGPEVYSSTIAASDMSDPDAALERKLVIWDNEPESAVALDGRSADLPSAIGGFLTNMVMIEEGQSFADFVRVVGTLADWTWNAAAYDPGRSLSTWRSILRTQKPCGVTSSTS